MDAATQDRAVRLFVGSLLSSDLTREELLQLARDPSSTQLAISQALNTALSVLNGGYSAQDSHGDVREAVENAFRTVQRRKLTKSDLLKILRSAPTSHPGLLSDQGTLRQILEKYLRSITLNDRNLVLDILEGSGRSDPYLKGILDRR